MCLIGWSGKSKGNIAQAKKSLSELVCLRVCGLAYMYMLMCVVCVVCVLVLCVNHKVSSYLVSVSYHL